MIFASCGKEINNRLTLWRNHKIPYGTYYAFNNLKYIFPNAEVEVSKSPPQALDYSGDRMAYIIIAPVVRPSQQELLGIINRAANGDHIFISAMTLGQNLLDTFKLKDGDPSNSIHGYDSLTVSIYDPEARDSARYQYPGLRLDSYFSVMDSSVTNVIGRDEDGNANFVKFSYQGGGSVCIQYAPTAFSNFFLLHKNNKRYYDLALSSIPDTVSTVLWDDYFRTHTDGVDRSQTSAFSKLGVFLKDEVLRWAFWLALMLLAIIYLFESKRRQRIVPNIPRLKNSSLDFVKTIGRLYYQRKDNKNLSAKMTTRFLGQVRSKYNLQTTNLSDEFIDKLTYKSGYPSTLVKSLVSEIKRIDEAQTVSDEELLAFNDKIDNFINKP